MKGRTIIGMAAAVLCSAQASAQKSSSDTVLQSFSACRTIAAPQARLDCFDRAAAALERAVKTKDITIVNRQEVRKARRSLFGFAIPRIGLFDADRDDDGTAGAEFAELNTTIVSVRAIANDRLELRLAEGDAVWATTDPVAFPPRVGAKIRIRRGALGNFFIAIDGQRSVRGTRIR